MITVDSALNDLGGTKSVADALGVPLPTVSCWRGRGFIPSRRWADIVRLASKRGCEHITFEALAELPRESAGASA